MIQKKKKKEKEKKKLRYVNLREIPKFYKYLQSNTILIYLSILCSEY